MGMLVFVRFFFWLGLRGKGRIAAACTAAILFGQLTYCLAFLWSGQGRPSCLAAAIVMVAVFLEIARESGRLNRKSID